MIIVSGAGTVADTMGLTWAGISNATQSPTGTLTKTSANAWDAGAVSVETMAGDCRLVLYMEDYSKRYFAGIGPDSSCSHFNTVDFAFFQDAGFISMYESGTGAIDSISGGTDKVMAVIERIGTDFDYYYLRYTGSRPSPTDGTRTHWRGSITGSGSTLYVNVALFHQTTGVINAGDIIWEAI